MSQAELSKESLAKKRQRTLQLREEYLKQIQNPHRHATGEGGTLFDTGIQRFQAMRTNQYDHFKPTPKSIRYGTLAILIPIVGYAWLLKAERDEREEQYRTGQVAYKDRKFKFI